MRVVLCRSEAGLFCINPYCLSAFRKATLLATSEFGIKALVQEIGSWNEMIAAFGGELKDLLGGGPLGVQSPITQFLNFEQLEAAGLGQLPPGYEKLAKLIERVGREVTATCA